LCGIIIKCISDPRTRLATKQMACKLLRMFHKEQVFVGVIAATTQCVEGTMLSWVPYLLDLFLDYYKDT
jgi:hypothetical protein